MDLSQEQIEAFKSVHKSDGSLDGKTDKEIKEIANGVAGFYLELFKIRRRQISDKNKDEYDNKHPTE